MDRNLKILFALLLSSMLSLSLISCDHTSNKACKEHEDADNNGFCDICGETVKSESQEPAPEQKPDTTPEEKPGIDAEYTLTFISEGTVIETVKVKKGEIFELPTPSRGEEYILLGWINAETGEKITDSTFSWSEDITLTAIWDRVWSEGF